MSNVYEIQDVLGIDRFTRNPGNTYFDTVNQNLVSRDEAMSLLYGLSRGMMGASSLSSTNLNNGSVPDVLETPLLQAGAVSQFGGNTLNNPTLGNANGVTVINQQPGTQPGQ